LHGFLDLSALKWSYYDQKRNSSSGVDGQTWQDYGKGLDQRLNLLLSSFQEGTYRAPAVKRVYIPKTDGSKRPIGIPTIEDKVLQRGVQGILEPVYEEIFKAFSFGFRPKRSQHGALSYLHNEIRNQGIRYIIDADIQNFFGTMVHAHLRSFLDHRIKDGVIRRMINKWLKAGILECGQLSYPTEGSPQGGVISPLLSNIYLHYVLDEWFSNDIQHRLIGKSMIVRYADDFILGFQSEKDAQRVLETLYKRFSKYGLTLHPTKTKLIDLKGKGKETPHSFTFLGFTHYLGISRKGNRILKRKTDKKKLKTSLGKIGTWIKDNRHQDQKDLISAVNTKLRGYYQYYGIRHNIEGLKKYYYNVSRLLMKWLNRRGSRPKSWEYYQQLLNKWCPLLQPRIYHSHV